MSDEQQRLVEEALRAGLVTEEQVEEVRGIQKTVGEIGIRQELTEILEKKGYLTENQIRTLQRELSKKQIGKYEILDKLGEGGAGVVYRARHVTMGRIVALKVLSNRRASDPQYLESFVREARVAVTLNHRSIVRGLDYGEAGGYHFFVMEFVPGETLYDVLQREGRQEEQRALEIGIQVADALRHARQFDLSHRDLKPDNILLSVESGEIKVCDLGLAKPKKLTAGLEGTGSTIGTPSYIAPEQIRGSDHADTRSDIYSLGATLYHAVCGQPPFTGTSVEDLLRAHLREEPKDPREIVVDLSSGTAAVLLKMLEKDPTDRYQGLDELIADLEAVRDGRPPIHTIAFARKGPAFGEGRTRAEVARQRSRSWLLLPVLGVIVVAMVLILALGGNGDEDDAGDGRATPVTNGGSGIPGPGPSGPTREQKAKEAFERANSFWTTSPEEWETAALKFEFVLENYRDTPTAVDARQGLQKVKDAWKRRAEEVWTEVDQDVVRHATAGKFGDALKAVESFPAYLRGAEGFEERMAQRAKTVGGMADRAWDAANRSAREAADAMRFDEALEIVSPLRECGIDSIEASARDAYEQLTSARKTFGEKQRAGETAFRSLYGSALLTGGQDGYEAAFRLLEEARDSEVFRLAQTRIQDAGEDLNRVEEFNEAIRRGYDRMRGGSMSYQGADGRTRAGRIENVGANGILVRRNRESHRIPWTEITPQERVEAALSDIGAMKARSRLDAVLWLLSRGRTDLAARQLEAAGSLGADVKPYQERATIVREARDSRVEDLLGQAEVHRMEERQEDALEVLDRAVAMAPDHAGARYRRGLVRAGLERDDALADFREAARLGLADPDVSLQTARVLERMGKLSEAVAEYDAYLKTSPEGSDAEEVARRVGELRGLLAAKEAERLRKQGDAALRKRDWPNALACFQQADELVPNDEKIVFGLARAAEESGKIVLAYASYRKFLELRPQGGGARSARKALDSLRKEYGDPEAAIGEFNDGEQYYKRQKWDAAIEKLDRGIERVPLYAVAYFNRAYAWYSKAVVSGVGSHAREAIGDFDRLLLLEPNSWEGLSGRALCWFLLRKPDRALEDARRAIMVKADSHHAYNTAARACLDLERYRDAIDYLDRAIELEPGMARLYIQRARAWRSLEEFDKALVDLDRATKQKPNPAEEVEIRDLTMRVRREEREQGR